MDEVIVEGRGLSLTGVATSATEGIVGRKEIENRPMLRPADVLETIPGMIITQHSGPGKGNQFFLRGFNLDHGTDFAVSVLGIPNNLPSHGHGQGYIDINYLIPELVGAVRYRKGPYYADVGDFATAGSTSIDYVNSLPGGFAMVEGGSYGYQRGLVADSIRVGEGDLLYAFETVHQDGPWDVPSNFNKFNGVARYSLGDEERGSSYTLLGYDGTWTATDQIPQRAVDDGELDRFGTLDPTTGGDTSRYSLSGEWWGGDENTWNINAYTYLYDLDLFSNFTYALNDPVNGDQFEQTDERWVQGVQGTYTVPADFGDAFSENVFGFQLRNDVINNGLYNTAERQRLSTVRQDDILQTSLGVFGESNVYWNDWFRSTVGLRGDLYHFDVESDLPANSGTATDGIVSPKAGVVFGPWAETEVYLQGGYGFHSNDARGVTTTDDPSTPEVGDGDPVDPLVRQRGAEIGVRSNVVKGLQSTLSFWYLQSDSELLFVGDAGTTEPTGATQRWGVEWTNFYALNSRWSLDFDLASSVARFTDAGEDDHVPGAIGAIAAMGVSYAHPFGHYGAIRGRYFGPRDLTEDGNVQSSSSFIVNAHAGYRFAEDWQVRVSVFNLFDADVNDIEYYYPSRLPGEAPGPDDGGYNDIHFHPAWPLSLRFGLVARF